MPSATPRRQSSHRRRRSNNTSNQPNPPRAQARRGGNPRFPQNSAKNGNTQPTGKAIRENAQHATRIPPKDIMPSTNTTNTAPLPQPPLEIEREIERTADTATAHPHHTVGEHSPAARPLADHPRADHLEGSRTILLPRPTPEGRLIAPLPSAAPLPRTTLPLSCIPPLPPRRPTPTAAPPPTPPAQPVPQPGGMVDDRQASPHPGPATHRRSPNVRAALSYAIPFAPAVWLLARERRAHLVRLHAAQSLVFFGTLLLAQVALFVALINLGQSVTDHNILVALGLLFFALFGILGIGSFVLWLLLLSGAMAGRLPSYPSLSPLATLIERGVTRLQSRSERGGFRSRATR